MDEDLLKTMETAGVEIKKYHPLRWYNLSRMNNRTHRKLLVVDGTIGFTGGVGIADQWLGNAQDEDHWRDSHYRLEGPAVAQHAGGVHGQLDEDAAARCSTARSTSRRSEPPGEALAQVFKSSPGEGSESVRLMYLLSIAQRRQKPPDRRPPISFPTTCRVRDAGRGAPARA